MRILFRSYIVLLCKMPKIDEIAAALVREAVGSGGEAEKTVFIPRCFPHLELPADEEEDGHSGIERGLFPTMKTVRTHYESSEIACR